MRHDKRSRSDVLGSGPTRERHWQFGPKIRIGGSVGKIGQNIKNSVTKGATDAGHFVGKVADNPWVQGATAAALAATGVGAPAAAAILAAERGGGKLLKPGGNIGQGIKGGIEGAVAGYGAAKAGSLVKGAIGKALPIAGSILGGGGGSTGASPGGASTDTGGWSENDPYGDGSQDWTPAEWEAAQNGQYPGSAGGSSGGSSGGGLPSIPGEVKGLVGQGVDAITGAIKNHGSDALAAYNIYQAAQRQGQADKYAQEAVQGTEGAYNAKAPLRSLGIAGLSDPGANVPNLSNIKQLSTAGSGNPFAKALPVAGAAAPYKKPALPVAGV